MNKKLLRASVGVGSYLLMGFSAWSLGQALGVDTGLEIGILSFFTGLISIRLTSWLIVTKGTQYRFVYQPEHALALINAILGTLIGCSVFGAAILVAGRIVFEQGLVGYLKILWMPPLWMCFLPATLMSWKDKEGDEMCRELASITSIMGVKLKLLM